ncbi:MAG TPA: DUF2079 domain-containing protein, partial [Candidatus Binatia bacterium]|nr:DUF2079 domain-containing protein [Candidatus Binatia bacterium]
YRTFGFVDWDLAIFSQILWSLAHGSAESSLLHLHFLGNHANFLAYALVPAWALVPHPGLLLALKAACCTLAVVPLHRLARARCGEPVALALVAAFLLYAPLTHVLAGEFDYEAIAPLLLLWLWVAFLERRRGLFVAAMVPVLLLKENMPLLVAAFGIAGLLIDARKRWWAGVTVVSLVWFAVTVFVIVPAARGGSASVYWTLYGHLGSSPREILTTLLLDPGRTAKLVFSAESLGWLAQLVAPLGAFAILGADAMLLALPVLAQDLLSSNTGARTIYYHYVATLTPFVFVATVLGIARLRRLLPRARWLSPAIAAVVLASAVVTQLRWGPWAAATPAGLRMPPLADDRLDPVRRQLVAAIPADAGVVATFAFLPALSARRHVYAFHDATIDRLRSGDPRPWVLPAAVEYALIDFDDLQLVAATRRAPGVARNLATFYRRTPWTVVRVVESLVLLQKGGPSPPLVDTGAGIPLDPATTRTFAGGLHLVATGPELGAGPPAALVPVTLSWQTAAPQRTTYTLALRWVRDGVTALEALHPVGYRMFPAWTWPPGRSVREQVVLQAPQEPGTYDVTLRLIDDGTRRDVPADGPAGDLSLGRFTVVAAGAVP